MPIHVSRRRWLLSAMLGAASAPSLWSDEPGDRLTNASQGQWLPPSSRSIQLTDQPAKAPVITAIAVDPRGELVAVAGDDHLIRILATSTLIPVRSLAGHRDLIRTITFDPSGGRLASAGNDGQLILWDRDQSFRLLQRLTGTPCAELRTIFAERGRDGGGRFRRGGLPDRESRSRANDLSL